MTWKKCLKIIGVMILLFVLGSGGYIFYDIKFGHSSLNMKMYDVIKKGDINSVTKLLDKGADINGNSYITPLTMAVGEQDGDKKPELLNIAKLILQRGADINFRGKDDGKTALHHACFSGNINSVNLLLANGADINIRDKDGKTALFEAQEMGRKEVVNLLIAKGANVSIKDNKGKNYKGEDENDIKKANEELVSSSKVEVQSKPDLELTEKHSEDGYVCGTIVNNTDKEYRYVQVDIGLYDSDKNKVGSTFTNVTNLQAKGKWKFRAPILYDNAKKFTIDNIDGY